ncbi:MAG TPA: DinB family protein [Herpetosiphonaceae bacterium]
MDYREPIISQYHAALDMLKQSILACPETLWHRPDDRNTFSQVAYHALFFTHLYLQESEQAFRVWSGHRDAYRFEDDVRTQPAESATKATVLAYLAFCQRQVVENVSTMELAAASGFDWLPFTTFEVQLYSIRHIQQHVGELMERLGTRASAIDWVGSCRDESTREKHP